jgi:hypothetical protein
VKKDEAINGNHFTSINYIKLINWIWENIPFIDGCKACHLVLLLAIIDSVNRNKWLKVSIPYDYLINKCKFSKQVYLDARQWLIRHELLELETGRNGYQMATFNLGIAVRKQTAILTATNGIEVQNHTADHTGTDTSAADLLVIKQTATRTHLKTVNNIDNKTLNISFDQFWQLYDKKVDKVKCIPLWQKLTDEERQKAMDHIPAYKISTPEIKFRKNPATYLRNNSFENQIISDKKEQNGNHSTVIQNRAEDTYLEKPF